MIIINETDGQGHFAPGTSVLDFFGKVNGLPGGDRVQMGVAVMPAHTESKFSAHAGDEYSFVVSGSLRCFTHEESFDVPTGSAIFTPAGQEHRSVNSGDEDCLCLWIEVDTK